MSRKATRAPWPAKARTKAADSEKPTRPYTLTARRLDRVVKANGHQLRLNAEARFWHSALGPRNRHGHNRHLAFLRQIERTFFERQQTAIK